MLCIPAPLLLSSIPGTVQAQPHEPFTLMSANKDSCGFIDSAKSVYPEIRIRIVPCRGANTTRYCTISAAPGTCPTSTAHRRCSPAMTSTRSP